MPSISYAQLAAKEAFNDLSVKINSTTDELCNIAMSLLNELNYDGEKRFGLEYKIGRLVDSIKIDLSCIQSQVLGGLSR